MTASITTAVVASYDERAQFARAETVAVRRPRLLRGLLNSSSHVAEVPCGAGHFLADYARADVAVTLVDANAAMLAVATEHAIQAEVPIERTFPRPAYWQKLTLPDDVDLVVVPNAALNQLVRQAPLTDLVTRLRAALRPDAEVLAQVACTHPGGGVDRATFYDPARPHGVWFADRWFEPTDAGGAVVRRRRQHRDGNHLRIDFDYHDPAGISLHATTVAMNLLSAATLIESFTAGGFSRIRFLPGRGGLSEILASAGPR